MGYKMVFIAATRSSTATASRAVVQRLMSTSTTVARPGVTSESRKIAFVGAGIIAAYVMQPSTSSASCDSRLPMAPATQKQAPLTQFFGPDQRISSFQRNAVGVPLRLTFVENLALTNTQGIHHVGSF